MSDSEPVYIKSPTTSHCVGKPTDCCPLILPNADWLIPSIDTSARGYKTLLKTSDSSMLIG